MTLVDTNVLVDILNNDASWRAWSSEQLDRCHRTGAVFINEITYAELAAYIPTEADLQFALAEFRIALERAPTSALFLAGKAFQRYRAAGGPRASLLPDFLIGAHAEIAGWTILTRDPRRYRSYFRHVRLIVP